MGVIFAMVSSLVILCQWNVLIRHRMKHITLISLLTQIIFPYVGQPLNVNAWFGPNHSDQQITASEERRREKKADNNTHLLLFLFLWEAERLWSLLLLLIAMSSSLLPCFPPYLLQLPGEGTLLADDDGDVVLLLEHLDASPGDPGRQVIAAVDGEELVVAPVEHPHLAPQLLPHRLQVALHLLRAGADDVVQGVPCRVVRVAHEHLDHERPHPAQLHVLTIIISASQPLEISCTESCVIKQQCRDEVTLLSQRTKVSLS